MRSILVIALALVSIASQAAAIVSYEGAFKITPEVTHRQSISGVMSLMSENGKFVGVDQKLDKAVFGMSDLSSSVQFMNIKELAAGTQLSVAYQLDGPPHEWFFVFVSTSIDGGLTYPGTFYKVDLSTKNMKTLISTGVSDPVPSDWKKIGEGILKKE